MSIDQPVVKTASGAVAGVWRGQSAAFLGIPFAQAPVGELRFAAPVPVEPWDGVRDATEPGPTPQRRPFGPVTTIPEPSIPGDATLNVNVFTPAPGDDAAKLPVMVWIHGGGFFAGSPSSPWYDGRSYNRDGVVTVSLSYRLGFDGFGWIADAPTNRGVLDMIAGLEWVQANIAAFGGDPAKVTIAGQSAGGAAVLTLLSAPRAQHLFARVIAHSGAVLALSRDKAEEIGKGFAAKAGVEPTRAGWSTLSEDAVLDLQQQLSSMDSAPPPSAADFVRGTLSAGGVGLAFVPLVGDDVVPLTLADASREGIGQDKDLLIGTVAHEFSMANLPLREAWAGIDPVAALSEGGLPVEAAQAYVSGQPELTWTADLCAQLITDLTFRLPSITCADARPDHTWVFDFRWPSPLLGLSFHCLDLPFAWDVLDAEGVAASAGANPPQELAASMHADWVGFITSGDPGWPSWDGHNPKVFGAEQADHYAVSRLLTQAEAGVSAG